MYLSNSKGLSIVESLLALASLGILALSTLALQNDVLKSSGNVTGESSVGVNVRALRFYMRSPEDCADLFDFSLSAPLSVGGLSNLSLKKPNVVHLSSNDFYLRLKNIMSTGSFNGSKFWFAEVYYRTPATSPASTQKFLNTIYLNSDTSGKITACYSAPNLQTQCLKIGGVYNKTTQKCTPLTPQCPSGYFLTGGTSQWQCQSSNGAVVPPTYP